MHGGLGEPGEFTAVPRPAGCDLRADENLQHEPAQPGHPAHRVDQRFGADERWTSGLRAGRQPVPQPDRPHRDAAVDRGLERCGHEPARSPAAPRGALGGDVDQRSPTQRGGQLGDRGRQAGQSLTVHEHRAGTGHQPAEHRPPGDLRLGERAHRLHRVHRDDVQPGDVVVHHERTTALRRDALAAVHHEPGSERAQDGGERPPDEPLPGGAAQHEEHRSTQQRRGQHARGAQIPAEGPQPTDRRCLGVETPRTARRGGHPGVRLRQRARRHRRSRGHYFAPRKNFR